MPADEEAVPVPPGEVISNGVESRKSKAAPKEEGRLADEKAEEINKNGSSTSESAVNPSTSKDNSSDDGIREKEIIKDEVEEPPSKKAKVTEGANVKEQASPVPDDPDVKVIEEKAAEKNNSEEEEASGEKMKKKKEPELTSSEALLKKLEEYISDALDKGTAVDRKVLDALLGAINIQVQREPLSVRKLILEKQLVLPNTISFPPSQVVDMVIEHDPDHPLARVISKMFPDERIKLSDAEKREKHALKMHFGAPHMTKALMEIGQDLVQEATYSDIVHARNLPETPKNLETYKQVAAQLKPVWESLKKKNEPYKLKYLTCQICQFRTESRLVMIRHRSTPHFDGKVYKCGMCPEFDTNEQRLINHYIEVHEVIPPKEDPPLKNPCYVCDEDFQLKGQREAHFKVCKRDFYRLRHIMAPKSPEDMSFVNQWLWDKPPVDPSILAQQQHAQQQQLKQQRANTMAAAHPHSPMMGVARPGPGRPPLGQTSAAQLAYQQQAQLVQQRIRTLAQQAAAMQQQQPAPAQPAPAPPPVRQQNSLIAAMQQHLQRAAAAQRLQPAAGSPPAGSSPGQAQAQAALIFQRQLQQQQQAAAAAAQLKNTPNMRLAALQQQQQQQMQQQARAPHNGFLCEICDQPMQDKERFLVHVQGTHKQLKGRVLTEMQQGPPLACSRCRDRFWTYEGLERHLVMAHGLVTQDLLLKAKNKEDGGRCKICTKQYAFNILQHLVADHQVKLCSAEIMYSCDVCSFKCQSYQKLETHLATVHPKGGSNGVPAPSNGAAQSTPATPSMKSATSSAAAECITLDD